MRRIAAAASQAFRQAGRGRGEPLSSRKLPARALRTDRHADPVFDRADASQELFRKLPHFPDVASHATDILLELPVILANDHWHPILRSQSYMYKAVHS